MAGVLKKREPSPLLKALRRVAYDRDLPRTGDKLLRARVEGREEGKLFMDLWIETEYLYSGRKQVSIEERMVVYGDKPKVERPSRAGRPSRLLSMAEIEDVESRRVAQEVAGESSDEGGSSGVGKEGG
jgi:hypothetical protein